MVKSYQKITKYMCADNELIICFYALVYGFIVGTRFICLIIMIVTVG